jgi:hypothetical protein
MDVSSAQPVPLSHGSSHDHSAERLALLERTVVRLRREMDRMARVMALLEHDRAVERIMSAQPGVLDRLSSWLGQWATWLSPWSARTRPRAQRPAA